MPKELEFHPLSELLPMMSEEEYAKLRADIVVTGLQEPITLFEGKILDGRNRHRACTETGVKLKKQGFSGDKADALEYVMAKNLRRRQLNASQKAIVALNTLPHIEGDVEARRVAKIKAAMADEKTSAFLPSSLKGEFKGDKSTEIAGDMIGVSGRYVAYAKLLREKAPKRVEDVFNRKLTLSEAVREFKEAGGEKTGPTIKAIRAAVEKLIARMKGKTGVIAHLKAALEELVKLEAAEKAEKDKASEKSANKPDKRKPGGTRKAGSKGKS